MIPLSSIDGGDLASSSGVTVSSFAVSFTVRCNILSTSVLFRTYLAGFPIVVLDNRLCWFTRFHYFFKVFIPIGSCFLSHFLLFLDFAPVATSPCPFWLPFIHTTLHCFPVLHCYCCVLRFMLRESLYSQETRRR